MIAISRTTAGTILKILDDIEAVQAYAHCSDSFFRKHFVAVALGSNATDARRELAAAVAAADAPEEPVGMPKEAPEAPAKRSAKARAAARET